jgi:Ca2+-binding RTX toxin-like protein
MATHTINNDRTTPWKITASNDTYNLARNAELNVVGEPAIYIATSVKYSTVNINGDVTNSGTNSFGIYLLGDHNTINIGKDADLKSSAGLIGDGLNTTINNKGNIDATAYGIYVDNAAHVTNSGRIDGFFGVGIGHDSSQTPTNINSTFENVVINRKGGEIWGGQAGVAFNGDGKHTLVNDGFVTGATTAVANFDGNLRITNTGRIDGDILFGDNSDTLDTRHGEIHGIVHGGGGNDTFWIASKSIHLSEVAAGGYDTVKSSVSYNLADNLDKLVLLGKADLNGKGNAINNLIEGNAGDNKLSAGDGADHLGGGKGTDSLTGGIGSDTFIFHKGDGVDTVTDFDNAADSIDLSGFSGVSSFAELSSHITAHGNDVWITLGSDKLILHDAKLSDMDVADFNFPV